MNRTSIQILFSATLLLLSVCMILTTACAREEQSLQAHTEAKRSDSFLVNGLSNSEFEWIADSTTDPAKYGAYWLNAFSNEEGNAFDLIVKDRPFSGKRLLRLSPGDEKVTQKIACDTRWTDQVRIVLALRLSGEASLEVSLEDGPGNVVTARFLSSMDSRAVNASWLHSDEVAKSGIERGGAGKQAIDVRPATGEGRDSWLLAMIDAGAAFKARHGTLPMPRLNLHLECRGPEGAHADVDHVIAEVPAPYLDSTTLSRDIVQKVLWSLETWYLPEEQGGLGLVDPQTGYARYVRYHIETGEDRARGTRGSLHTIQDLLLRWVAYIADQAIDDPEGWGKERDTWVPHLETYTRSLVEHNFDPETHLPRAVTLDEMSPIDDEPVTVAAYIDYLMNAREAVIDVELKKACLAQARKTANRLLALRRAHDLGKRKKNKLSYNKETRQFEGHWPNWNGLIPDKITPRGVIEPPKRFNTSWAIVSGKRFWYHYFKTIASIMGVNEHAPDKRDLEAVIDAVTYYHRDWDAARYDLENDTDDHYGYYCMDLLRIIEHGGDRMKPLVDGLQAATDHRLERDVGGKDGTLWIQGIRLGSACAGDSPRAFEGVVGLYQLPPHLNPISSGLPMYREALLELATNDFKGRQLTNAQFTQSFFKNWEMVCICFKGSYQGDCREKPASYWHGDVGDTFGGPPTTAIYAQSAAYRVAARGERAMILSRLATILHVTDSTMRRRYGYLYGLDESVAKQYELPDKYVMGVSRNSPAFLGYVMALIKLLPDLTPQNDPGHVRIDLMSKSANDETGVRELELRIQGPANGRVVLPVYTGSLPPFPAVVSESDSRITAFELMDGWRDDQDFQLDENGQAIVKRTVENARFTVIQPILLDDTEAVLQDVGAPLLIEY